MTCKDGYFLTVCQAWW